MGTSFLQKSINVFSKTSKGGIYCTGKSSKKFDFKDDFNTVRAISNVDGTSCEPGPGTRTIVDTESKLSIANGKLTFAGGKATPSYGDPGYWISEAITREAGKIIAWKVNVKDITKSMEIGLDIDKLTFVSSQRIRNISSFITVYDGVTQSGFVYAISNEVNYFFVIVLRVGGAHFYIKPDGGTFKKILSTNTESTGTLYIACSNYNAAYTVDSIRIPRTKWLPTPLLSDSFAAANATVNDGRTSDGLGHLETTGLGSGGSGVVWSGASGAIQSNRLVITPTLGSELLTDGGLENWSSATNLTSWIESVSGTSTVNREPTIVNSGTYACRMDGDASNSFISIIQTITTTALSWILFAFYAKATDVTCAYGIANNYNAIFSSSLSGVYTKYTHSFRTSTASNAIEIKRASLANKSMYIDDVSIKKITLSSCFATTTLTTTDIEIKTSFKLTAGTQAGIVFGLNDAGTSFGLAYHDGANVKVEICESGTYTTKTTTAITYSADAELRLSRRTQSDGTSEIWCWYNNAIVGTGPATTLSAGEAGNLSGLKVGLFSTYGGSDTFATGDFSTDDFRNHYTGNSFNDCTVYAVGSANEFSILDRLIGG